MALKDNDLFIFCEICCFKKIVKEKNFDKENFIEIKTSKIQKKIPNLKNKDINLKEQNKKIKCPSCGRGVVVKKASGAYIKTINSLKKQEELDRLKKDQIKRIEDGKPLKKGIYDEESHNS